MSLSLLVALLLLPFCAASDAIVSNNWQCTNIGQELLGEGATVEQVYIAVSLCEGLVHPMDSGLGGGFQALVHDNRTDRYLMSREYSPWDKSFARRPLIFGNSIAVPAVLAGYAKLLGVDRCASRNCCRRKPCRFRKDCSLATYDIDDQCVRNILDGTSASGLNPDLRGIRYPRIFEPIIDLALNGFEVSRTLRVVIEKSDQLPYFLREVSRDKISNVALGNFLSFLAYNPIRLLDPYYAWSDRKLRDDLNTTLIMLKDARSYNSHLTDYDFFTYRATWRKTVYFNFNYKNQTYRFASLPKPAGGETIVFFFRMLVTLLNSDSHRQLSDVQLSTIFTLFSKYSFAAKLYFRQMSRRDRDRLLEQEAPRIARKLVKEVTVRRSEASLVDYLVHEIPGIPNVFGTMVFPKVLVFQIRGRKRPAAFTGAAAQSNDSTNERPETPTFFYTKEDDLDDTDDQQNEEDETVAELQLDDELRPDDDQEYQRTGNASSRASPLLDSVLTLLREQLTDGGVEEDDSCRSDSNESFEEESCLAENLFVSNLTESQDERQPSDSGSIRDIARARERIKFVNADEKLDSDLDLDQVTRNLENILDPTDFDKYRDDEYDSDDVLAGLELVKQIRMSDAGNNGHLDTVFGTTNVVVKRGNRCIVSTSSINHSFGSLVFSQNLGIPYNNVLRDFTPHNWFLKRPPSRRSTRRTKRKKGKTSKAAGNSTLTRHSRNPKEQKESTKKRGTKPRRRSKVRSRVILFANRPRAHSVPQSSMAGTIIWNVKSGHPVFVIGAAGGFKITSAIMNILWNYFVLDNSLEKSYSRLRLTTKLNYKTRQTEIWYEFPIESPFYSRLLKEKSLIYNQLNYDDFNFLSTAARTSDFPRLAHSPRFFFNNRLALNVKYIFEAGYSAATGCSTMRNSRIQCNFDRRRGGKVYVKQ